MSGKLHKDAERFSKASALRHKDESAWAEFARNLREYQFEADFSLDSDQHKSLKRKENPCSAES